MKRTVLLFFLLGFFFVSAFAQNKEDSLVFTQFFYGNEQVSSEGYLRNGQPDGKWTSYYADGTLKSIGKRTNYLLDSLWQFFNQQGLLTEEINYLNGKKSGFSIKYQSIVNGEQVYQALRSKELFLNDKREQLAYYYNDAGHLDRVIRYKDGKKHGLMRIFNSDSLIQSVYKYHNDFMIDREFINQVNENGLKTGLWKSFYDNDQLKREENYRNGNLHGYVREYSSRGELLISQFYEDGKEIQRPQAKDIQIDMQNEYNDAGELISSGGFVDNTPVGVHRKYTGDRSKVQTTEFSSAGELLSEGTMNDKGQMNEYWKFYYPNGSLSSEGEFSQNLRSGVWKYYYPSGALEQTGTFRNGKEDGLWVWYYEDGSVRREENYYRGREDGMSTEFDPKGNILVKGEYLDGLQEGEWIYKVGDHIEKGSYQAGEKNGLWLTSYADGKKKTSGNYVQGFANGKHRSYYSSGKLKEEKFFEMGRKEKTWRKLDEAGNVVMTTSYSNDRLVKINGVRVNLEEKY